jgi:hypothetical protein
VSVVRLEREKSAERDSDAVPFRVLKAGECSRSVQTRVATLNRR